MAMGQRGQQTARDAIAACRPFTNSTGNLRGTRGNTAELGWLRDHREAARIRRLLATATYVVWSYDTPIGFIADDEDGNTEFYYVAERHSATTAQHQSLLRTAWGEYESIGEDRRRPQPRRRPADSYTPGGHVQATDMSTLVDAPASSLQTMLDPRYADPDWVPPGIRPDTHMDSYVAPRPGAHPAHP